MVAIRHDVVEGVVATLKGLLVGQPGLLQQADHHVSTGQLTSSLGIASGLQDRVGVDTLVLKGGLTLLPLARRSDGGKVGEDLLGVLSLSSTRPSSNLDWLPQQ